MAKSRETWNKKETEKKKQQKRKEKEQKKEDRKANAKESTSFEEMMAYVDEYGNITSTPPDPTKKIAIREQDIEIGVPRNRNVDQQEDTLRKGVVTFFNESKGFGFIRDMKTQESVFVHVKSLTESIKENNRVTFEVEMGPKGANAVNVKVVR